MKLVLELVCFCIIVKTGVSTALVNTSHVRVVRQANTGCVVPHHPNLGKWTIYQATSQLSPGQLAPPKTVLQVNCNEGYKMDGDTTIVCIEGHWTAKIGKCLRKCPPRYSTPIMKVTCTYNGRKLDNCDEVGEGTQAQFQCATFYEDLALERHPVHFCRNGRWSHHLPECFPICGLKSVKDPTLTVGGRNATKGEFPWQVALYNATDKDLLCGGTLLNQRVVLTAAHCVSNENGVPYSKEIYMVAVGKYYRRYDHPEDMKHAQFSAIYEIYTPRQYRGDTQNYFGDVAILITKKTFTLSTRTLPICVDWSLKHQDILLDHTRKANTYVSGWGFTAEYKNPSDVLKELEVPLISDQECLSKLPEDYTKFMTDDKLCAGFLQAGKSVCKGDSGGGLVTQLANRYYVIAVVSLSPRAPTHEGGCDSQQYALYTKVHYYIENFVRDKEADFRPSTFETMDCEDDPNCRNAVSTTTTTTTETPFQPVTEPQRNTCVLPEHPESGRWSLFGSSSYSPGRVVSPSTILQVSCNNGYKWNGNEIILCENGKWSGIIGECLRPCPSLQSTPSTEITCSLKNTIFKDCSNPPDGTIAKHNCAPFYEDIQLSKNPVRVCRNGSWDKTRPECIPICGLKSVTVQTLIVNGKTVNKGEYPWQVALYRDANKQFICGGTLISQKLILTAAHCVTNYKGKPQRKEDYVVAVGKFYREYYDPLDATAQFSELQNMFIPLEYAGSKNNFLGDIAVLVAKKSFVLSTRVQPACVDWGLLYQNESYTVKNRLGYISGWGFTGPSGKPSDTLQDLQVPMVSKETCMKDLPDEFHTLLTSDKFCGGYINRSTSACSGDAGGGLVTKYEGRYYVTGIISTAPALPKGGCDTNQYTLYTKVSTYNSFIVEKDAQIKTFSAPDVETATVKPTPKPGVQRTTCILPSYPNHGRWSIYGSSSKFSPGGSVIGGTILQITCDSSYKLEGDNIILCEKGKWSSTMGACLRTCPDVKSTPLVKATCIIKNKESDGCVAPAEGTRVKYECAPYYEDLQVSQNPIQVCQNGKWSHTRPNCLPVCGQKSLTPQILIVNGETTKKGDYPWHIAIYRGPKKEFICSGTLISLNVILTAAHCVTNHVGKAQDKSLYTISAGKYYRNFDDSREDARYVQTRTLSSIDIPAEYKGLRTDSAGNIAMLTVEKPLTLSSRVQPVCVDWGSQYESAISNPTDDKTGFVTGWGFTIPGGRPGDELKELKIPIVGRAKCLEELPDHFSQFLTHDKFCAGYRNKGKSVCNGDSGGSLVLRANNRYFVVGILVSAPVTNEGCDTNQYALYTEISPYLEKLSVATQFMDYIPIRR